MLIIKSGVRILGLTSETSLGIRVVESVFDKYGLDCVITSVTEGNHSRGSLHYLGSACDFRIRHIPGKLIQKILATIKKALGSDFDFILEKDHFHMEYQPKTAY